MTEENENLGALAQAEAYLAQFVACVAGFSFPGSRHEWEQINGTTWRFCHVVQVLNLNCGRVDEDRFTRLARALSKFVLDGNLFLVQVADFVLKLDAGERDFAEQVVHRVKGVVDRCRNRIERLEALKETHLAGEEAIEALCCAGPETVRSTATPQSELPSNRTR